MHNNKVCAFKRFTFQAIYVIINTLKFLQTDFFYHIDFKFLLYAFSSILLYNYYIDFIKKSKKR